MFFLDTDFGSKKFATKKELKEYIELFHAEKGDFDWISEIKDDKGKHYGCNWKLEVELI
jgi:hypothetical protein